MRRSLIRSFGPLTVAGLLALASATAAIAEDTEFENVESDGSQLMPAGLPGESGSTKNLNTVPEDGMGPAAPDGPNGRLVRQLTAARPNEDLIICVAGCFSGRDRVVYAQPKEKVVRRPATELKPQSSLPQANRQHISAVQPGDGTSAPASAPTVNVPAAAVETAPAPAEPQVSVAPSLDPQAPTVLNSGAASDDNAAAPDAPADPSNSPSEEAPAGAPDNTSGNPTN